MRSEEDNSGTRQVFREPVSCPDHISSYFRREWKTLLAVAASGTLFNMGQSLSAIRQGDLVDAIARENGILHAAAVFLLTVLAVQLLRLVKRYYVRRFANAADISMRMMVYNHIVHEDYGNLCEEDSGQVMTRALGDVDRTVEGMRKATTEVFDTGVLLCTYFVTMCICSLKCTLLSVIPVPFALAAAHILKAFVEKYNRQAREAGARVAGSSLDAVKNSLLYRVTGSAGLMAERYETELDILERNETRAGILENSMQPVYNAITLCGVLGVMFCGGSLVLSGAWTVGSFTAYLTIYLAFSLKVSKVSRLFNSWQKASVSFARVKPYLTGWTKGEEEQDDSRSTWAAERSCGPDGLPGRGGMIKAAGESVPAGEGLPSVPGLLNESGSRDDSLTPITLICRDVTVRSKGKKELFQPVSFAGRKGQIIGITGPVGSGKSLLGMALAGLLGCRGSIKVLGHDLAMLTGFEKAKLISYMGHDPQLTNLTLKDNILLGRNEIPGRLDEVLCDVCLAGELPPDRLTGPSGKALSGGQRERTACARALYAHTPLIILDEPFANVDKDTEEKMIGNLKAHYRDSLLVIISHRMKVFAQADLVLMIEDNGFVRTGSHEELMKNSARYRESWQMQVSQEDKAGGHDHEE